MNITESEYRRIYHAAYTAGGIPNPEARDRLFVRMMKEALSQKRPAVAPHECSRTPHYRRIDGSRVKVEVRK